MKRQIKHSISVNGSSQRAIRFITTVVAIATLYLARDVLIPAALAVLLAFLLQPLVTRLTRLKIPHVAGVALAVLLACGVTGGIGWMVGYQFVDLSRSLPQYRDNLRHRIQSLRTSTGTISRISNTIQDIKTEMAATQPSVASQPSRQGKQEQSAAQTPPPVEVPTPVPVQVVNDGPSMLDLAATFALPVLSPIADAGVVLLLLIFLLLGSDDVRERLIWLAGTQHISLTTSALDEAGQRIGSYLRMQLLVNLIYGTVIFVALWVIGVPSALFWGVMAGALRFVPFVGPWIAGIPPTLLSIALFPGWARPLAVLASFVGAELCVNMGLEPWLYSRGSGISRLGIICAAIFWAWLWGPVGLILAVPMTVCLLVVGKQMPQLAMLNHLFGDDVELPKPARLYQRLLVGDEKTARRLMSEETKETSLAKAYENILLPALRMLHRDWENEQVGAVQAKRAMTILEQATDALSERENVPDPRLLCIAVEHDVDDVAATLLARAVTAEGVPAEAISSAALVSEIAQRARELEAKALCIVQVSPHSSARARRLAQGLATRVDHVSVFAFVVGSPEEDSHRPRRRKLPVERVFHDFPAFIECMREASFVPPTKEEAGRH